MADARFKAGISNYIDVIDAQRSRFSTKQGILELELQKIISQIELYQVLGGGANLDVPTVIPVPQHRNLVQVVNAAANSNKAKATAAIDAASSARVISAQEALAIKQAEPIEKSTFKPTAVVDINNDGKTDAALGVITDETILKGTRIKEVSVEQVPVTQIIEP